MSKRGSDFPYHWISDRATGDGEEIDPELLALRGSSSRVVCGGQLVAG